MHAFRAEVHTALRTERAGIDRDIDITFRKASAGVNTRWYQRSCFIGVQWPVPRAMGAVGGLGLFEGARVVAGSVSVRRAP